MVSAINCAEIWGNEYQIFDTLDADNLIGIEKRIRKKENQNIHTYIPLLEQLQRAIGKGQKNSPGLKPANK